MTTHNKGKPWTLAAIIMTLRSTIVILAISTLSCTNPNSSNSQQKKQNIDSPLHIEINLMPAFNSTGIISVDKSTHLVHFNVDSNVPWKIPKQISVVLSLDSFEANTPISAFYSQTFLDSIRTRPRSFSVQDGLSIYTVLRKRERVDTINSGNVYPKILSTNIIQQLEYISKQTTDQILKAYIKDVISYFE
jgi:hypothetical protein